MGRKATVDEVPGLEAREAAARVGAAAVPGVVPVRIDGDHAALEAVACRFGGVRWWWRCPGCGARRMALYRDPER